MCADIFNKVTDHGTFSWNKCSMVFVAACSVDVLKHDIGLFVTLSQYLLT